eukprot:1152229-Pelagomonas_calceolata.AAC.4
MKSTVKFKDVSIRKASPIRGKLSVQGISRYKIFTPIRSSSYILKTQWIVTGGFIALCSSQY